MGLSWQTAARSGQGRCTFRPTTGHCPGAALLDRRLQLSDAFVTFKSYIVDISASSVADVGVPAVPPPFVLVRGRANVGAARRLRGVDVHLGRAEDRQRLARQVAVEYATQPVCMKGGTGWRLHCRGITSRSGLLRA